MMRLVNEVSPSVSWGHRTSLTPRMIVGTRRLLYQVVRAAAAQVQEHIKVTVTDAQSALWEPDVVAYLQPKGALAATT